MSQEKKCKHGIKSFQTSFGGKHYMEIFEIESSPIVEEKKGWEKKIDESCFCTEKAIKNMVLGECFYDKEKIKALFHQTLAEEKKKWLEEMKEESSDRDI